MARRNSLAAVLGMLVYLVGTPVKVCLHAQFKHSCQLVDVALDLQTQKCTRDLLYFVTAAV